MNLLTENSKISIVLPVFNGEQYLAQSIESCLCQTYKNIELIIVDDCSTDNTPAIATEYAKNDKRIKYIRNQANKKLPASLNIGFDASIGDFLTWTSDDNFYTETAIEEMLQVFTNNKDIGFVFANMYELDSENIRTKAENARETLTHEIMFKESRIGACFLYKRSCMENFGKYREDLFIVEDYEYWMRLFCNDVKFYNFNKYLYTYRRHENSLTSTREKEIKNKNFELKLEYWNKIKLPYHRKFYHLYRRFRRMTSPELLKKSQQKLPFTTLILRILTFK